MPILSSGRLIEYHPVQRRLLHLFSDGKAHSRKEILVVIGKDEYDINDVTSQRRSISKYIFQLRVKVRELGQDILCEYRYGTFYYRHIILLKPISPSDDPM